MFAPKEIRTLAWEKAKRRRSDVRKTKRERGEGKREREKKDKATTHFRYCSVNVELLFTKFTSPFHNATLVDRLSLIKKFFKLDG